MFISEWLFALFSDANYNYYYFLSNTFKAYYKFVINNICNMIVSVLFVCELKLDLILLLDFDTKVSTNWEAWVCAGV